MNLLLKAVDAPGEARSDLHHNLYGRGALAANQHTWYARDAVSQQPHLRSSPVAVRRLSFGEPQPWLLERLKELDGSAVEPFAARQYDGS